MKHTLLLSLTLLAMPFSAYAKDEVSITKVNDRIHVLVSPQGGNVVLSTGEDGAFIIDDQLTPRSEMINAAISAVSEQPVKFVLNTHYHFDHTGGNEFFGEKGAVIVAHDNVRKRLNSKQFITYFGKEMLPTAKAGLPVVTFGESMTLHYNGDDIRVLHVPAAHTDGDVIAYFSGDNVLVGGDVLFHGIYPFIDAEHGGSIDGVIAALTRLLEMADDNTVIIPGHGALMSKADVLAYQIMLVAISDQVRSGIKDGKTLEQVIASKPTAQFDAAIDQSFIAADAFVTLVYEDLSR